MEEATEGFAGGFPPPEMKATPAPITATAATERHPNQLPVDSAGSWFRGTIFFFHGNVFMPTCHRAIQTRNHIVGHSQRGKLLQFFFEFVQFSVHDS
jgi:hypothetical protein